jgi:hypothetical protein
MAYVIIALCFGLAGGIVGKPGVPFFVVPDPRAVRSWAIAAIAYRVESEELRRMCPTCGRVTKLYDAICTRCGTELDFPDVAIAPESYTRSAESRGHAAAGQPR